MGARVSLLAESMLHTLQPFALQFGNGFGVRWYGISYAAGFLVAWLIMRWMSLTRRTPTRAAGGSHPATGNRSLRAGLTCPRRKGRAT